MKTHHDDVSGEIQRDLAAYDLKQRARRELAAGVLKQAAQDLRRFRGATSKVERELYFDTYRWLTVNESSSPFSFLNVCQFLHLIPEQVRHELIDASSSAFTYLQWKLRLTFAHSSSPGFAAVNHCHQP